MKFKRGVGDPEAIVGLLLPKVIERDEEFERGVGPRKEVELTSDAVLKSRVSDKRDVGEPRSPFALVLAPDENGMIEGDIGGLELMIETEPEGDDGLA